ncbi:anthranilate synthase component I [Pseudobutyrivibrio ruminis]|uniref:Anthranilate synthase component 1 n=1 Tax=Pseudobutyrivibrio ruminis TaxID=46206 RepID=A0A2G3DXS5_9FIRM|nr:anthranilate synthase component I [Pseudobutyrivibrio ruminis]PHU35852.1 anthranilate synthase component I [Pseudobutyrivibrio ruminis]
MFPSIEEVVRLAKTKEYKRIPVAIEMLSDSLTTIEAVRILRNASHQCYLLESASQTETWGRYSFLGFNPKMEITCQDGVVSIKENCGNSKTLIEERKVAHPGEILREVIKKYKSPTIQGLPTFTGGLVGYFSYDYIKYSEPKLVLENHGEDEFKDMDLMLFDDVIAFDNFRQKIYLITGISLDGVSDKESDIASEYEDANLRLEALKDILTKGKKKEFEPLKLDSEIQPKFTKAEYGNMVEKAKNYIKEGDIFQVVLSNPLTAKASGSLFDVYRLLRASNPSPYMFYFSSDDIEIAGASPETLVKVEQRKVSTFPLAGTRPRGKNQAEDEALEAELLADEKERAEHNMLVDLGRNDIGKISRIGSVNVEKYMGIERYSHVMHIGSTVVGELAEDKDVIDAVDAILPAGTLSGAPKFRACEIIEELEQSKRGIYGGALGYIDFSGNLDVCIAIRLVYKKNDSICIRSGAGIVFDSVPEKEAEECINKAKAVVKAVEQAEGGLE